MAAAEHVSDLVVGQAAEQLDPTVQIMLFYECL